MPPSPSSRRFSERPESPARQEGSAGGSLDGGCAPQVPRGISLGPQDQQLGWCASGRGSPWRIPRAGRGSRRVSGARGAQAKPRGGAPPDRAATLRRSTSRPPALRPSGWTAAGGRVDGHFSVLPGWRAVSRAGGRPRMARLPSDTEGLDLFLRQSCILILDVFPEAYFS